VVDCKTRYTAEQALEHPFITMHRRPATATVPATREGVVQEESLSKTPKDVMDSNETVYSRSSGVSRKVGELKHTNSKDDRPIILDNVNRAVSKPNLAEKEKKGGFGQKVSRIINGLKSATLLDRSRRPKEV
jgi:hypothetical protein